MDDSPNVKFNSTRALTLYYVFAVYPLSGTILPPFPLSTLPLSLSVFGRLEPVCNRNTFRFVSFGFFYRFFFCLFRTRRRRRALAFMFLSSIRNAQFWLFVVVLFYCCYCCFSRAWPMTSFVFRKEMRDSLEIMKNSPTKIAFPIAAATDVRPDQARPGLPM